MPADERPAGGSTTRDGARTPTRRGLLAAGVAAPAALLAACSLRFGQPDAGGADRPTADERARERAAADADLLAAGARAAARLRPDAATTLQAVARQHAEHAQALRPPAGASAGTTGTAGGGRSTSAGATTGAVPSATPTSRPLTRTTAVPTQVQAEQAAITAVEADLPHVSGDVARLLASVAACRAVHVAQLQRLATAPS